MDTEDGRSRNGLSIAHLLSLIKDGLSLRLGIKNTKENFNCPKDEDFNKKKSYKIK